jgi:predicted nucleic acid-binding protein
MRVYADTSVFGGVFDSEFATPSNRFFAEVDKGLFSLVTSAIVAAEIEPAPQDVREFFERYVAVAEVVHVSDEALQLQQQYLESGIVTSQAEQDALHVAVASVSGCDMIVSWNFKHIVHYDKIAKFNAVNVLEGHKQIGIFSPLEVISYDGS